MRFLAVIPMLLAATSLAAPPVVLVFTKTTGFRHESIANGVRMLRELAAEDGFVIEHTEDPAAFTDERLARYAAVVFLLTTGDVLDPEQQRAFERYVEEGGAWVGIHAAADTEYEWPWYGELVGAWFASHPAVQPAAIDVADADHPSTAMLPERWERTDEWYNYRRNPREAGLRVLLTLDESTYEGGEHGEDHPIAWCHEVGGGRAWYTGGGHTRESYAEPLFRRHVQGGLRWAMRPQALDADSRP
jgi:type 1 glutamine amidotransferase